MKYYIFLTLSLFISINSFNLRSTKQDYDSYVMAVIWVNGYCKVNNCTNPAINYLDPNIVTIHGLWPSLKNGKMLPECTSGVKIEETDSKLFFDLKRSWPTFYGEYTDFWEHEYNKHGYCMVEEKGWKGYEDYFRFVDHFYLKYFKYLILQAFNYDSTSREVTVSQEAMKDRLKKIVKNVTFKMLCHQNYIDEFYFYLNKDLTPSTDSVFSAGCRVGKLIFKKNNMEK